MTKSTYSQYYSTYYIAAPPYRGWQRSEGLLLLHTCAFSASWAPLARCLPPQQQRGPQNAQAPSGAGKPSLN